MPIVVLTKEFIANSLTIPPDKIRIEYCCSTTPGLYVEVRSTSPNGGTYYYRHKVDGKTTHTKLGRTTEIDLNEARQSALDRRNHFINNRNAPEPQKDLTLDEYFYKHYVPYKESRKRSLGRDLELYGLRISGRFGDTPLRKLSRQPVEAFHAELLTQGLAPATADHHIRLFKHCLRLAVEWGYLEKHPLIGIKLFNVDNKVENYLNDDELESLLTVLRTHPNRPVCGIALYLLSTGCRLNEALRATWDQIDLGRRLWCIPATNSKSKKLRPVPLNDTALEVLLGFEDRTRFVFVNTKTGKPYTTIMKSWERIRCTAGLPHLRVHDLRHMYASFLVNAGRSLYEVQNILGHSDPKVTQRYAHLNTSSLLAAANSASVAIRQANGHR